MNWSRFQAPEQHQIVAIAIQVVAPDGAVRKHVEERSQLCLDSFFIAFVQRQPLRGYTTGIQMTAHESEVFLRVERRRAFHPRMNGIGRDDIEFFWCGQYEV